MWILKCKFTNKENILNKLANKYNLKLLGFPLNIKKEKNYFILTSAGFIEGEEKKKKQFIKKLKKQKEITNFEEQKNFIIMSIKQPIEVLPLYEGDLIYINPVIIKNDFSQEYEIAHWKRKKLEKIMNITKKNIKFNLIKIKNFAFKNKYYDFPRKSNLITLSKKKKQPISTFQKNLRKAEKKIMEFFLKM
ncbi:MAG: helix-turn-helix domain-containing protein [Nanoarchaeota archaeon]|nr:helix-turn-helix domain-containing protein [Nanoarchaeota archaeon]